MTKAVKTILNFFKSIESKANLMDNGAIKFEIAVPHVDCKELLTSLCNGLEMGGSINDFLDNFEMDSEPDMVEGVVLINHLEVPDTFVVSMTVNLPLQTPPAYRIEILKFIALMGTRLHWPTLMYSDVTGHVLCRCSTYVTEKTFNADILSELITCILSAMDISSYGLLKIYRDQYDAETAIQDLDLYIANGMQEFNEDDE